MRGLRETHTHTLTIVRSPQLTVMVLCKAVRDLGNPGLHVCMHFLRDEEGEEGKEGRGVGEEKGGKCGRRGKEGWLKGGDPLHQRTLIAGC